jgi:transketolase
MSADVLDTYYAEGTLLAAHPVAGALEDIPAATGSLGHGLPIACGIAFAHRTQHRSATRCVCLVSDGDCNEGSTWEAAAFAAHHHLGNLTVIVDQNRLQGFGHARDVLDMEPLAEKWQAFGFDVRTIDGHDFDAMTEAMSRPAGDRPLCIVAETSKGRGVSFMQDRLEWHYLPMTEEQYRLAVEELDRAENELFGQSGDPAESQ